MKSWQRHLAALALAAAAPLAQAGYFQWEMVELPPESGAACGNGSPYRFFVNRTPFSHVELSKLLAASFERVESVDLPYYLGKYPKLAGFWRALFQMGLARFVAPSVYFRTRCRPNAAAPR